MIEVMRDVTKIKREMDELMGAQEMFRTIAKTAADAIVVIDDRGMITFWNPSAERMFGYSEDEALGKELHIIFAPEKYHKAYRDGIRIFGETGKGNVIGKTLEFTAVRKDGTEFPIEVSTSAIRVKGRWHAVGIIRDITEKVRLNEDLRKRIRELEEFYDIAVTRELRMIELKEEIDRLKEEVERLRRVGS
jgi:PAS domain S-box-containing protein